jgi:WXG100 family type VII secretion target
MASGGMVGMDLALGEQMASNFRTGGADLQAAVTKLDAAVSQSESFWKGTGASQFRAEWAEFKPQALKMIAAIQQDAPQAITAAHNAIQQATGVS